MANNPNFDPHKIIELGKNDEQMEVQSILLLEDDPQFSELLKNYLESLFFNVTAVKSGVEGLKATMVQDFDVIICDMMMPTLPGDMFYRAIERTKPYLCRRFIFITGYKGMQKIDDFIKSIKGTILQKPFHMDDMRETIYYTLSKK
jgi:CheY-like chemotaxis protein